MGQKVVPTPWETIDNRLRGLRSVRGGNGINRATRYAACRAELVHMMHDRGVQTPTQGLEASYVCGLLPKDIDSVEDAGAARYLMWIVRGSGFNLRRSGPVKLQDHQVQALVALKAGDMVRFVFHRTGGASNFISDRGRRAIRAAKKAGESLKYKGV